LEKQIAFKKYIASQLIGKNLHFKCDCTLRLDVVGRVVDYNISANEIIFIVDVDGKLIRIGENHPNMYVIEA
jgi:hypothetical protein